jgi:hypothetical protein
MVVGPAGQIPFKNPGVCPITYLNTHVVVNHRGRKGIPA